MNNNLKCKTNEDFWEKVGKVWSKSNVKDYKEYSRGSESLISLICDNVPYHGEYTTNCNSFSQGTRCSYCGNHKVHPLDSFAQWGINNICSDFLELYWDYEKNAINPWEIKPMSDKKVWMICQEKVYHGSYDISCNKFSTGRRCPYCNHNSGKVHTLDSFAQYHIDNTDAQFLIKYWDYNLNQSVNPFQLNIYSHKDIYIKCQNKDKAYHGSYKTTVSIFSQGNRCPYCNSSASGKVHLLDSLGTIYPQILEIWSNKNKKTAYEYTPNSGEKVFFKCENNIHDGYSKYIQNAVRENFRCPDCVRERDESFLQGKVRLYLNELGYNVLHEYNCILKCVNPKTKQFLPFDNEVPILKLIIEIHGKQHYQITGFHKLQAKRNNSTMEREFHMGKVRDRYKRIWSKKNDYFYLEIPYWTDNEQEEYKELIDNKIKEINNMKEK